MNWRKFYLGMMGRDENVNETETDTDDDDEVTESNETVSTEKSSRNVDTSPPKLFYKWLPEGCLKFSFLLLNSVALLAGVTAITMSVLMLNDANFTSRLLGQRLSMTILSILGVFVSLVAFTGIIGIAKKKEHFMIFYVMCQSIALCAVFVSLTMSFPFFDKITKKVQNDMIDSMNNYQSFDWAIKAWDNTHRYLNCCGIRSSKDWLDHQINIPQSCCSTSIKQCLHMTENVSFKSGCFKGAIMLLKSYVQTASISTLVIFPLLLISVLLALGLRKGLKINRLTRDEAIY
ncbi:leukocyte surface antigen CD53-like [Monomorium pharaonis]|uniref:leukocyte surface antigen CD53-like n=1 Tax=Monomorium pharaonis TaxID=307658 RepID=UPI00063ED579|nr:leukocyte surface antigen CD53-like [Monomorium pharaonis]XP_036138346.1 leukocyte surface antigen CD53-like [Monomorium pharaonis]XP_036138352.1 leukocyte surface antigen CD53-like [Monomorium pharaonis]